MAEIRFAPTVRLNNGMEMPVVGIGTFGSDKYNAEQISNAVYGAVKNGYRLIDGAETYHNEAEIGQMLKKLYDEGVVKREDLFITSKVWNDHHRCVEAACEQSLKDVGTEYFDAYFIHWPFPNYHAPFCTVDSRNPDSKPFSVDEFVDTYRQCEKLYKAGKIKSIGLSNMTVSKLEKVLPLLEIKPALCELELHPAFQQKELFKYLKDHDIQPVGFCPLGSPSRPERDKMSDDVSAMSMPVIKEIAERHNIHPAGVCIKWSYQYGAIPIPFSVKEEQYVKNLSYVCEDPLTDEEMQAISEADANCRLVKGHVFLWEGAESWEALWD